MTFISLLIITSQNFSLLQTIVIHQILICLPVHFLLIELSHEENSLHICFFFKQKTAYDIGLGIPAEPLFRSSSKSLMRLSICLWKPSISTLSQSPMLGFHKQMDNRIKLLEEILSFRMQGVEFDNGDMYVDGHKAASDVRDEFVSVTEKLMDELAQCYNVLPQLDINNTIDHRPEGDEKWFLENE